MKIVHVIHCCNIGGAEIFVKNLAIEMKNQNPNYEIEIWAIYSSKVLYNGKVESIEYEKKYIKDLNEIGINVVILNKSDGIKGRIDLYKRIKKEYKRMKPNAIFCHLETVTFHVVMALLFKKVDIYETIHTNNVKNVQLHKWILGCKINKYIAISESVKKVILEKINCNEKKIILIKNGINTKKFDIIRNFEKKDKVLIVSIGRLIKEKNHILLLEAMKRLNIDCDLNNIKFELQIYGDGLLKDELNKYILDNRLENCKIMGATDNVPHVLQLADIYVMPSIIEGFSISLIEARTSGIAIICTNVGGNKEIIKNDINGIVIDSNDSKQLCKQLKRLIVDKSIREKFYSNSKKNVNEFNIKSCAENYIKVLT